MNIFLIILAAKYSTPPCKILRNNNTFVNEFFNHFGKLINVLLTDSRSCIRSGSSVSRHAEC